MTTNHFEDIPFEIEIVEPREFEIEAPEEGDGADVPEPVEEPVEEPVPA